jgi:succinyl-CoA synthetase beta subunit
MGAWFSKKNKRVRLFRDPGARGPGDNQGKEQRLIESSLPRQTLHSQPVRHKAGTLSANNMNLHEYQGKSILAQYGVRVQRGLVAYNADEAVEKAKTLSQETGTKWWVVKAQIHAGGRGKGGGVKLAKNLDEVRETLRSDHRHDAEDAADAARKAKKCSKVLIAEDVYYPGASETKEFYMSVLLDRASARNIIMYSTEGGMDIEEVAEHTRTRSSKKSVDPRVGLRPFQCNKIATSLGRFRCAKKEMAKFVASLYKAYEASDSAMFEINPVLKTSDDKIIAVDAKVRLDGNALYRHPDYVEMRDKSEEDPIEVEAGEAGLNYVKLDGNVGCMVNGAGLAMATMDIIKLSGGEPCELPGRGRHRRRGPRGERLPHHPERSRSKGDPREHLRRHRALRPCGTRRSGCLQEHRRHQGAHNRAPARHQCQGGQGADRQERPEGA